MSESNNVIIQSVVSEPKDGMVRVFLSLATFRSILQSIRARLNGEKPELEYTGGTDAEGKGLRKFIINGVAVYDHYKKDPSSNKGNHYFFVAEADTVKLGVPRYERKEPVKAPFSISLFDDSIVASITAPASQS